MSSGGDGVAEGSLAPLQPSPLDDFFSRQQQQKQKKKRRRRERDDEEANEGGEDQGGDETPQEPETVNTITWKDWRTSRKRLLVKFLERRILEGPGSDDEDEEESDSAGGGSDGERQGPRRERRNAGADGGGRRRRRDDGDEKSEERSPSAELETQQQHSELETQQQLTLPDNSLGSAGVEDDAEKRRAKKRKKADAGVGGDVVVPHVVEGTLHEAEFVADLNLRARTMSLALASVETQAASATRGGAKNLLVDVKRWSKRPAHAREKTISISCQSAVGLLEDDPQHGSPSSSASADSDPSRELLLRRVPPLFGREDGPLGCVYKQALCLHLKQLNTGTELRRRAENIMMGEAVVGAAEATAPSGVSAAAVISKKRVRVFFYSLYAQALHGILQGRDGKRSKGPFVALENVPAKCIFPFEASDWYERQHYSDCCVCIGDDSNLSTMQNSSPSDERQQVRERFDSHELKVRVGWETAASASKGNEGQQVALRFEEYFLKLGKNDELSVMRMRKKPGPLAEEYLRWTEECRHHPHKTAVESNRSIDAAGGSSRTAQRRQQEQQDPNRRVSGSRTVSAGDPKTPPRQQPSVTATRASRASDRKTRKLYNRLGHLRGIYESHKSLSPEGRTGGGGRRRADDCMVNLYGVVLGFGCPARTKRGDWMIGVALVDDSFSLPEMGDAGPSEDEAALQYVSINIFTKKRDALPDIRRAGEVLRLHRVIVQEWKDEIQLLGRYASSYVVFRDSRLGPTAGHEFEMTPEDEDRFNELSEWAQKRFLSHPTMKISRSFEIAEMARQDDNDVAMLGAGSTTRGDRGDLTAMVAAIIGVPEEQRTGITPRGYLRIWDGTGPPVSDPPPQQELETSGVEPPSQALERIAAIVGKLPANNHRPSFLPPKAVTGRVVNLAVWEDSHWDLITKIGAVSVGSFIRLRNIDDNKMINSGIRCLMLKDKSYLTPLPDLTYEVIRLLANHDARLARHDPINPRSGILPLVQNHLREGQQQQEQPDTTMARASQGARATGTVPLSTGQGRQQVTAPTHSTGSPCKSLRELLSCKSPSVFTGCVRIVDTIPPLRQLHSPEGFRRIVVSASPSGGSSSVQTHQRYSYQLAVCFSNGAASSSPHHNQKLVVVLPDAASNCIVGMSAGAALENVSEALSNLQKAVDESYWEVRIQAINLQGRQFFLVETIKEMG